MWEQHSEKCGIGSNNNCYTEAFTQWKQSENRGIMSGFEICTVKPEKGQSRDCFSFNTRFTYSENAFKPFFEPKELLLSYILKISCFQF